MTRPRALVVDDDRTLTRTLADILALKGWDVVQAHAGNDGVAAAAEQSFDVVLMDVKMPGMDGVDAFKAMKQADPNIRVILMTAYAAQDRLLEAEREGVMHVLSKPVNIAGLLSILDRNLHRLRPVLIIDDDVAFLQTLAAMLRAREFEVVVAEDLEHAARILAQQRPVAVLLHVQLASPSARDAVIAIHRMSPAAALVVYTEDPWAAEELRDAVPLAFVRAFLRKPFGVEQITGVLDDVLERS